MNRFFCVSFFLVCLLGCGLGPEAPLHAESPYEALTYPSADTFDQIHSLLEDIEKSVDEGSSDSSSDSPPPPVKKSDAPGTSDQDAPKGGRSLPRFTDLINSFSKNLFLFVKGVETQFVAYATLLKDPHMRKAVVTAIGTILGVVFSGLVGEGLFYLLMRRFEGNLAQKAHDGHLTKREIFWIRGCLGLLPILIFILFSSLALIWFAPGPLTREIILLLMLAAALYKVGARTSNLVLNPKSPPLRLLSVGQNAATQADRQFRVLFLIILGVGALIDSMLLLKTNTAMLTFVIKTCILLVYLGSLRFVLKNRRYAMKWVEQHISKSSKAQHWSEIFIQHFWHRWHIILSLYLTVLAAAFILTPVTEYGALLWDFVEMTLIVSGFYGVIFFIPSWMEKFAEALIQRVPGLQARKHFYASFLSTVAVMLCLAVMLLLVGAVWDVNFFHGLLDGEKASLYIVTSLSILLIILLGVVFWEGIEYLVIGVLEPYLKKKADAEDKQRIETLMPIVRLLLKGLTIIVVAMMIFAELDLNITPIVTVFASLGIAVGLGGQKLAQDLITGTFILAENTISMGDIVEINGLRGRVENTTLRTVNLRDSRGYFHSIPYSAITAITNTSKEYSRCFFEILIAYEYDYDYIAQILLEVDSAIRKDPHFSPLLEGEFVLDGIQVFDTQGYLVRGHVNAVAGKQVTLKQEYHRMIKKYFDKYKIQHPYDRQNIVISNLSDIGPILQGEAHTKTPTS